MPAKRTKKKKTAAKKRPATGGLVLFNKHQRSQMEAIGYMEPPKPKPKGKSGRRKK